MNGGVESESHHARWREQPAANIFKTIQVGVDRHSWLDRDFLRRLQVVAARRMDVKHRDQRRRIRELEGDIVSHSNQDSSLNANQIATGRRFFRWPHRLL